MRRRPDEPEVMGAHEASKTLKVQQTNLRTVAGLPEPYQKLAAATLWRATEIRALAWTRSQKKIEDEPANGPSPFHEHTTTEEEGSLA